MAVAGRMAHIVLYGQVLVVVVVQRSLIILRPPHLSLLVVVVVVVVIFVRLKVVTAMPAARVEEQPGLQVVLTFVARLRGGREVHLQQVARAVPVMVIPVQVVH
jgi:hypothetical protein